MKAMFSKTFCYAPFDDFMMSFIMFALFFLFGKADVFYILGIFFISKGIVSFIFRLFIKDIPPVESEAK